jgi:UDP-3-O-[3-hydroxymyristoyl] glucosamine N-acyltransferase
MPVTLADIAAALSLPPPQNPTDVVANIAPVAAAGPDDLTMVAAPAYARALAKSPARAAIVQRKIKLPGEPVGKRTLFRVDDVDAAVAAILPLFAPAPQRPPPGIHPTAVVDPTATLGANCAVAPHVVVGQRCRLGDNVHLHPGVILGDDVTLGNDCQLFPHVVIRERITLGQRVIIHAGSVIGTDGFGYRWDGRRHAKVPQIGAVVIEDDVEIGSCSTVDRAKFGVTRIGAGTKIDNLVQVAHNVQVGPHCIIVAQTGIAGSTTLGAGVILGGQTAVRDHITLGDAATAAACSAIAGDVPPHTSVSGMPALPHRQSLREQAALRRLPELLVQVRKLQEEIAQLKQTR